VARGPSFVLGAFFALSIGACGVAATDVAGVSQLVLSATSATVEAGATVTLSATVLDGDGNAVRDRKVVWASEDASIANVSQSGVVTGVAAGNVRIAASSGGKSASALITVTARPVTLVRVTPGSATIAVAGSITLSAEPIDASGTPVAGRPVTWSSSNETVAIVSARGVVAGLSPGVASITATVDGRSGFAVVTVAPQPVASVVITPAADSMIVGSRRTLRASALDAQQKPLSDRIVVWSSSDPVVAPVSSEGEVLGLAVGSVRIRATVEGKFAEAAIVISPVPVARIVVAPNQITLDAGQTSQLTVTLRDSAGNVLSGRSVTYSTSDASIATVSATGLVTAIAEGTAQIRIASEGVTATLTVTVQPVAIAAIRVTPNVATLQQGHTTRLVATPIDANGRALTNRSIAWSSDAPSVATVDQNGQVTAVSSGTASIRATSEGHVGSATINVPLVPVAALSVAPKPLALTATQTQQLSLQLRDSAGAPLSESGRTITWTSRNSAVASVTNSGLVAALAPGNTHIVVSTTSVNALVTDSVAVSVSPGAARSLALQPGSQTLTVGQSGALRAVLADPSGVVRGRAVAWQSRAASVATVAPVAGWPDSAVVVAVALGSTWVMASEPGGLRDSALVTVQAAPVSSVVVSPASANLAVNGTAQLSAQAQDATGKPASPAITWASLSPNVATVSSAGLVTGKASGSATIEARALGAGVNGSDVVGQATVTVSPPIQVAVSNVSLSSPRGFIVPGDTMHLTVVLRDSQGNVLTGRSVTFTSSSSSRMTVSAGGIVTGVGTSGSADITATSEGKSAKISISSEPSIGTMSVSGPAGDASDLLIPRKGTKRYTVTVTDAAGKAISGQSIAVSTSSSLLKLSKTSITTNSSGQATVDVTAANQSGLAALTFTADRAGAVPPAAPGRNTVTASLPIGVP
jgi:trimeric autotransporter adhesin